MENTTRAADRAIPFIVTFSYDTCAEWKPKIHSRLHTPQILFCFESLVSDLGNTAYLFGLPKLGWRVKEQGLPVRRRFECERDDCNDFAENNPTALS